VLGLLHLVGGSAHGTGDTVGDRVLAGDVTLGLLLVGLLGSLSRLVMRKLVTKTKLKFRRDEDEPFPGWSQRRSWQRC